MQTHPTHSILHSLHDHPRLDLDLAIWQHRMHYGQERDGYPTLYWLTTVRDVQRFLRGERTNTPLDCIDHSDPETPRHGAIVDLLDAARDYPHPLWLLLLMVAFEDDIFRARLELGTTPDANDDRRVLAAFESSVAAVSRFEGVVESVRLVSRGLYERIEDIVEARRVHGYFRRARVTRIPRKDRDWADLRPRRPAWRQRSRLERASPWTMTPRQQRERRITGRRGAAYRRGRWIS
jgi:hypothetical protein